MEDMDFKYHKERILDYIKEMFYYRNKLTDKQLNELMIDLQDLLLELPTIKNVEPKPRPRGEPFPEFRNIIEQTNRRLNNG